MPSEVPPEMVERAAAGLARVRGRIADAGGDLARVRVVAVTKGFGPEAALAALELGILDLGENYAAELVSKADAVSTSRDAAGRGTVRWHYLGAVQRRKVRGLAPVVSLWQGVARLAEGAEIAKYTPGAAVLVEVDTTGLEGRGGVPPGEVASLVGALITIGVKVEGLMTVAPAGGGTNARRAFDQVTALADALSLTERSMGMSGDLEEAVRAGTTMVRVGEAIFGPRPTGRQLAQ
jgi:uncharacterized pyridoxal phosphate-containing UPF0001 family protein